MQYSGMAVASVPLIMSESASGDLVLEHDNLKDLLGQPLIEELLGHAMQCGGEFAELFLEHSRGFSLALQEGKIRAANLGYSLGAGIRVITGDRSGYAYSDDISRNALLDAASVAAHIASGSGSTDPRNVREQSVRNLYKIEIPSDSVAIDNKVDLVQRADTAGHAADPRVYRVDASYYERNRRILVADTSGRMVTDDQSNQNLRVSVFLEGDSNNRQHGSYGDGGRVGMEFWEQITPEDLAREAVRQASIKMEASDAPSGEMPVVIGGKYGGVLLHEAIGHGLEADFNRKNLSRYSGMVGQRIAPESVTIMDAGEYEPKEWGTLNIDDEGVLTRKTVLVERGILRGYMQDRLNARLMSKEPTGNGRRESFHHMPMPRMTNTILEPGSHDPDEIIQSVSKGFYAKVISNGQVDISGGDFMFFVEEGYLIENGKLTTPVRGATLIGNGPDTLSKVEMLGTDFALAPASFVCGKSGQMVPVGIGMPTMKVSNMTVGGTS